MFLSSWYPPCPKELPPGTVRYTAPSDAVISSIFAPMPLCLPLPPGSSPPFGVKLILNSLAGTVDPIYC